MALALATETMAENNRLHAINVGLKRRLSECEQRFEGELRRQELLGTAIPMATPVDRHPPVRRQTPGVRLRARAEAGRGRTRGRRHGRTRGRRHGRTHRHRRTRHRRCRRRQVGTKKY